MIHIMTMNELNKSTYNNAADKLDALDYQQYDPQYTDLSDKLRKHAIYMNVQQGTNKILKKILKELNTWKKDYKEVMVNIDNVMKTWNKRKYHPRTQKSEWDKWMREKDDVFEAMREDIFAQKNRIYNDIIAYCKLEVGSELGIIDHYDNKEFVTKISQIIIGYEVRFHNTESIELDDLIYLFADNKARNITEITKKVDMFNI